MNDVYRAPSPLGAPSFACLCRFLCSCFLRRSPWPAFADPSLFGALQLRSTTPELIPSKWDTKQASSTSLSMLTFAPWPNITKRRGRHRQEGRLDLLWQRITQKLQFKYNPMVFLVPLDAFFHCAIDEHDVMPSRPRSEMLLPWKVYPHWDADFCMEDRWRVKAGPPWGYFSHLWS